MLWAVFLLLVFEIWILPDRFLSVMDSLDVRDALLFTARKGFAEHTASAPGIPVCTLHSLADKSIGKFVLNIVMGQLDNLTHIQAPTFRLDFSRL